MSGQSLIPIASYGSPFEAEFVRGLLQEEGFRAVVNSGYVHTALSAIGSVPLLVLAEDASAAQEFLRNHELPKLLAPHPFWYCQRCDEAIEPNFDVCWNCSGLRDDVQGPFPSSPSFGRVEMDQDRSEQIYPESNWENPFAPPGTRTKHEDAWTPDTSQLDDWVLRAYRASLIGFFLFPIIIHAYALGLLLRVAMHPDRLNPRSNRRWYLAFLITILGSITWSIVFGVATLE